MNSEDCAGAGACASRGVEMVVGGRGDEMPLLVVLEVADIVGSRALRFVSSGGDVRLRMEETELRGGS